MNLQTPIKDLNRVGKTTAKKLAYLGLKTAGDLLYYFPFRYEDFSRIVPIRDLKEGETVTIRGKLELIGNRRSFRRRTNITEALISDVTGSLRVVWFNQPFIAKMLQPGDEIFLAGKVRSDMLGPQLNSPVYEKVTAAGTTHTARLVPIYPLTSGITQKQLRFLMSQIIDLTKEAEEWLPENILEKYDLVPLSAALRGIHFPVDAVDLQQNTRRLKFEELFLLQLQAGLSRAGRARTKALVIRFQEEEIKSLVAGLPFTLTKTQKISTWEILQDLSKSQPMNRLLSGDVGSGKTVVAAIAAYNAVLNGYQVALMAPTEILTRQHYDSLVKILASRGVKIGLLTSNQVLDNQSEQIKKNDLADKIKIGELQIIIGTQALLSEKLKFKKLGLVVVDEQHRFGVDQRKEIKDKGKGVHFLSMTATPIPRSLALAIYGDLDLSIINELPPGRKKILTRLVEPNKRQQAYDFIREQVRAGRQVFVICPLIEEAKKNSDEFVPVNYTFSGTTEKKSVLSEYKKLSEKIFPDLKVGYLHGKMPSKPGPAEKLTKNGVMEDFKNKKIDILVSTSVVEVGVDIPNASVMMIEGADRFGLAQLHQFRGRVGRAEHQSYCFLFTDSDSPRAMERLSYFEKTSDGFKLAEKDLMMRGPGEVYGTEQSGLQNLRLASLSDREIIKIARDAAEEVVPVLNDYPVIKEKLGEWTRRVHLE